MKLLTLFTLFGLTQAYQIPRVIQGGMGVRISAWTLAREVSQKGELGVISGTALDSVFCRELQMGKWVDHVVSKWCCRRRIDERILPSLVSHDHSLLSSDAQVILPVTSVGPWRTFPIKTWLPASWTSTTLRMAKTSTSPSRASPCGHSSRTSICSRPRCWPTFAKSGWPNTTTTIRPRVDWSALTVSPRSSFPPWRPCMVLFWLTW